LSLFSVFGKPNGLPPKEKSEYSGLEIAMSHGFSDAMDIISDVMAKKAEIAPNRATRRWCSQVASLLKNPEFRGKTLSYWRLQRLKDSNG
jgi:hypothetical protein